MGSRRKQTLVSYQCCQQVIHSLSQTQFSHLYNGNSNISLRQWIESCPRFLSRILHSLVYSPWIFPGTLIPLVALRLRGPCGKECVVVCCCSVTNSWPSLGNNMDCSTTGFPVHHQLSEMHKLVSIELVMLSNHLILCHLFLLLPSILPRIRVFSNESVLHIR